jgi:ubiquinone/menaquinone biosynthesis C-methylase UbiE
MSECRVDNPFFARVWTFLAEHELESVRKLRKENLAGLSGRVLEVGAGTGTNFVLYPTSVEEVVAVEPEPGAPFDAVVCSLVLCSVEDQEGVLRQLFSILRPGGQLRYFEHVASGGMRGRLQQIADATLWPRLFGNCHTHRDTERAIVDAGFVQKTTRHDWTLPAWVPVPSSEHALGRAIRPA